MEIGVLGEGSALAGVVVGAALELDKLLDDLLLAAVAAEGGVVAVGLALLAVVVEAGVAPAGGRGGVGVDAVEVLDDLVQRGAQ